MISNFLSNSFFIYLKQIRNSLIILIFFSIGVLFHTFATPICSDVFKTRDFITVEQISADIRTRDTQDTSAVRRNSQLLTTVQEFTAKFPNIWERIHQESGPGFESGLATVIKDENRLLEISILYNFFNHLLSLNQEVVNNSPSLSNLIKSEYLQQLTPKVGEEKAKELSSYIMSSFNSDGSQFLSLTFKESRKLLFGNNEADPLLRDPNSLVSFYISEASKILGAAPAEVRASFFVDPKRTEKGYERLYISVDSRSFPVFKELILNNPLFFSHHHSNQQGTLHMAFNGVDVSYAGSSTGTLNFNVGTVVPSIILSSTESSRLMNYFELGRYSEGRAKFTWNYGRMVNNQFVPWVTPGAYTCCTHWIGDVPFGDQSTHEVVTPGAVDNYAFNHLPENDASPRRSQLNGFTHYHSHNGNVNTELTDSKYLDRLSFKVWWDQGESPSRFYQVLGLESEQGHASLVNPGYVLYSELGSAKVERIPLVFVYRTDATQPLTQNEIDGIKDRIHPY